MSYQNLNKREQCDMMRELLASLINDLANLESIPIPVGPGDAPRSKLDRLKAWKSDKGYLAIQTVVSLRSAIVYSLKLEDCRSVLKAFEACHKIFLDGMCTDSQAQLDAREQMCAALLTIRGLFLITQRSLAK